MTTGNEERLGRERDHWDHVIPSAEEVLADFERGPDPNTELMLASVKPGPGRRIIDFACGSGATSLWLAREGAEVTGIDLSPKSIEVAKQAAESAGLTVNFVVADLEHYAFERAYDGMVGKYALHHLDVALLAPAMARCVKLGATAAFVETMAMNPVLRLARKYATGKFGIARYGTLDEHPLVTSDIAALHAAFGRLRLETRQYQFLSLFDRQVLRYKYRKVSSLLAAVDQRLGSMPVLDQWGYHQVLIATRIQ